MVRTTKIELSEQDIKELILRHVEDVYPDCVVDTTDISILVGVQTADEESGDYDRLCCKGAVVIFKMED